MKRMLEMFKKRLGKTTGRLVRQNRKLVLEGLERRQLMAVDLNPGDLAVVGYNTGGAPDSLAVVFLRDVDGGTQFFVNDNEIASTSATTFTDLNEGEASFTVKAGQTIAAGTVVVLPWGAAAVSTPTYDWTSTTGAGLGNNNDELFFYEASAINSSAFTQLLYFARIGTSATPIHNTLALGTTAITPTGVASRYKTTGAVYNGTAGQLLTAIGNTATNWEPRLTTDPLNATDWTFIVSTGNAPEANVQGNATNIVDGDTTPSSADHTEFPTTVVANTSTRTFTIQNTGTADLTLSAPTSSNALFAISGFPAGPIIAGGSATFDVVFSPTAAGSFTSAISFSNNDSDESPYDFVVGATSTAGAAPEVNVQGNATDIVDGDTTPSLTDNTQFVDTVVGNTSTRTYTIQNTGTADLTLSAPASSSALFTINNFPAGPITAGNSATFDIVFAPVAAGAFTSTISFANNDSDENPYDFAVSGTGLAAVAEANVRGNAVDIVDGDATPSLADHTQFLGAAIGGSSSRTFTIQNSGTVNLTLGAFSSTNPLFTIPSPPTGPVAPGASVTFSVVFTPTAVSTESATISFVNNDDDENPYNFDVSAAGLVLADVRLNEIFVNPNGTDDNREYVEIRSVSGGVVSLAGLTLLVIESDSGASNGTIDGILPLDSFSTGSNGLLQLGNNHSAANPWPVVSGTSVGDLNLAGVATGTNVTNAGGLENGGITFLIVSGFNGTVGTDLSSTDNGVFSSTPWSSIVDSVGWGSAVIFSAAVVTQSTGTSDAVSRIVSDTTASSTAAWFGGDVEATPSLAQGYLTTAASANLPAGAGITPGSANYSQTISVTPTSLTVPEGGSSTFAVSLSAVPLTAVTVTIAATGDSDLTSTPTSLTFAAGSTAAQNVTINAAEDLDSSNGSTTFDVSASNVTLQSVNATEVDNDSATVTPTVTITSGNVVYNNSVYIATASVTGFNSPDPTSSLTFTYFSDAGGTTIIAAPENVGTYFVRAATAANAGNNAAQSAITQFQITAFALTASATAANKVYDGNTSATVTIGLTGVFSGDVVTGSATGAFDNKNVGTGKAVTVGTVTLAGADSANYTVGAAANTTANVTTLALAANATAANKVYDGNTSAVVTVGLTGVVSGDVVTGSATGTFDNKNVGTGKAVTVGTVTLAGADSANYTVGAAANTTANVTALALTANATAANKVYDGNTSAVVTVGLTGVVSGDVVTGSATGAFDSKNVGTGKTVTVGTVTLAGADSANYTVGAAANTTANVTTLALTANATAANKVYDGNTSAVVTVGLTGVVSGDVVTGSATGAFDNKNVGTGKTVTVGTVTLAGTDSANYTVGAAANTTANVTPMALTVTADAKSKTVGQSDPALTFTTSALASGDTVATALSGGLTRDTGEVVGTYPITVGTLAAVSGNYAITFVGANLTINSTVAAPTLTSVIVNGADTFLNNSQRSMVTSLVVTFSAPVTLAAGAFSIANIGLYTASNVSLAQSQILVTANGTNDVFTIRFGSGAGVNTRSGSGARGNSLVDGNYRLTIDPTKVTSTGGNLTGNSEFGAAAVDNFFRLYGDGNGDGRVDGVDLFAIRSALASGAAYNAAFDWDGNGSVSVGSDTSNFSTNQNRRRRMF